MNTIDIAGALLRDEARLGRIRYRRHAVDMYIRRRDLSVPGLVGLRAWRANHKAREGSAEDTRGIIEALRHRWHKAIAAPSYTDLAHNKEHVRVAILAECRTLQQQGGTA